MRNAGVVRTEPWKLWKLCSGGEGVGVSQLRSHPGEGRERSEGCGGAMDGEGVCGAGGEQRNRKVAGPEGREVNRGSRARVPAAEACVWLPGERDRSRRERPRDQRGSSGPAAQQMRAQAGFRTARGRRW